jgi:aspartyl-tRNA(Asn)/glutamyl-tRNA(Gln) amidotransferase subunit B
MEFEAVIGLEVHVQLATDSKIFCSCRARLAPGQSVADVASNSSTCPVCTGQPGSLPVLNKKVVEYAMRAGLATGCTINLKNVFSRKNYFYPDLPKGYQISQFDQPICENGFLNIETSHGAKRVVIQRIHMEEDAGKSVHMSGYSLVNLNRAGVPLCEIVSGPDMSFSEEAGAYLRGLYSIVTYLGICDGNLQEGNFRCDANVSVMPKGSKTLGTRAEIKNVNSFRFVEKAIDYEIARQIQVIEAGGKIVQETRLYDSDKNVTASMRSKEEAQDYRYFPDPDLMRVEFTEAWVQQIKNSLPKELPEQTRKRFQEEYGLSPYDAVFVTSPMSLGTLFEEVVKIVGGDKKVVAKSAVNFITGEVTRLANETGIEISHSKLTAKHLADLVLLVLDSVVSNNGAKQVIQISWNEGTSVHEIVDREGLKQVSDLSAIEPAVDKIIEANPDNVAAYRGGKDKILGFFVGQVMKETGGKANPALIQELVKKKLKGDST